MHTPSPRYPDGIRPHFVPMTATSTARRGSLHRPDASNITGTATAIVRLRLLTEFLRDRREHALAVAAENIADLLVTSHG